MIQKQVSYKKIPEIKGLPSISQIISESLQSLWNQIISFELSIIRTLNRKFSFFQENRAFHRHDCDEIRAKFDKCVTITTTTTTEESEGSSESSVEDIAEEITITSNTKNIDIDDCKHTKRVYELCFNSSIHHKILDKNIRGVIDVSKNS
jgi:hypothetical protein